MYAYKPYVSRKTKTRQLGVGDDGVKKFPRPRGKAPKGKVWNYGTGLWVELESLPFGGSEFIYKQWPPKEVLMASEKWKRRPGNVDEGIKVGQYYQGQEVNCRWLDKVYQAQVNMWLEKEGVYDLWFPGEGVMGKVGRFKIWVLGGKEMTAEEIAAAEATEGKLKAEAEEKKNGKKREREEGGDNSQPPAKKMATTSEGAAPTDPPKKTVQMVQTQVPEGLKEGDKFNFSFGGSTFAVTVQPNLPQDRLMKINVPVTKAPENGGQ